MQIRTGNRKASRTGLAADSEAAAGPAIPNALFLYRQSDKLPEKAFNHLAGFGMLDDHSGQRTGLAPNGESIPALLALRSPANRVQQSHRRQDPSPEQRLCVAKWARRNGLKTVFVNMSFPEG